MDRPLAINTWKQYKDLEWGVTTVPRVGAEKGTWAGSHNFVIPQQRNQDPNELQASKVFINWIGENSAEWAEAGQVPARESVRETQAFQSLKEQNVFADELPYVHFSRSCPVSTISTERAGTGAEPSALVDEGAQICAR